VTHRAGLSEFFLAMGESCSINFLFFDIALMVFRPRWQLKAETL
jgi:hypothetical protein